MIINVNKPKGISSFAVVSKVRRVYKIKKVGHAGTLDPLASGVLVVAIGREDTKKISEIVGKEKEYIADLKLGRVSESDDAERIVKNNLELSLFKINLILNFKKSIFYLGFSPKITKIEKVIKKFIGEIKQLPPIFSAIKINGKRAYKSARAGEKIELKTRPVLIKEIEILKYNYPDLKIRVVCGSGTYIRSLARDIGKELGTGAYMSELVRTRVGEFKIEDSIELSSL